MQAVAMQQLCIGVPLGNWVSVQKLVGVDKTFTRGIESLPTPATRAALTDLPAGEPVRQTVLVQKYVAQPLIVAPPLSPIRAQAATT